MTPQTSDAPKPPRIRVLEEALLSSTVAAALFIGRLVYILKNLASWTPVNDSTYVVLRNAYRVVDFLRLQSQSPVATSALRRQMPSGSERLGIEIFVVVTLLGAAAAMGMVLRLLRNTRIYSAVKGRPTLGVLLFAAPACYLYVSWWTWRWPSNDPWSSPHVNFFRQSFPLMVFLAEIAMVCVLLISFRGRKTPKWTVILFISLHSLFWTFVLWSETRIWQFPLYTRDLALLLFPCSALVCALRCCRSSYPQDEIFKNHTTRWTFALEIASLIVAGVVWAPARTEHLSHPQDFSSVAIELSWGPCFGSCPVYTITVRRDGQVAYIGRQGHSRLQTKKLGTVGREKIEQILNTLDRVSFTTLDDRAFSWGFDSPSVGVGISVDGITKRVVSDAGFVGSPNGRQARFVQATREIDGILEATEWSQCEGEECASPPPR